MRSSVVSRSRLKILFAKRLCAILLYRNFAFFHTYADDLGAILSENGCSVFEVADIIGKLVGKILCRKHGTAIEFPSSSNRLA